jgi:hypothetical protein
VGPRTHNLRINSPERQLPAGTDRCHTLRVCSGQKGPIRLPAGLIRPRFAPTEELFGLGDGIRCCVFVGVEVRLQGERDGGMTRGGRRRFVGSSSRSRAGWRTRVANRAGGPHRARSPLEHVGRPRRMHLDRQVGRHRGRRRSPLRSRLAPPAGGARSAPFCDAGASKSARRTVAPSAPNAPSSASVTSPVGVRCRVPWT